LVLIDEILDLSKIEAQQLTIKLQDFSIDNLMTELLSIFNLNNKNPKVEFKLNRITETKELYIHSDRVRVKQIFINLLSNASKFTDSGFIQFGYSENENQELILFVRDSGIGIKEEHQQVIFDRFRKLNVDGAKVYRGTGLGLSITKKLVELLGGNIWIESEPGIGTVFFFNLQHMDLRESEAIKNQPELV
jgi:signal transduction histidine kinase